METSARPDALALREVTCEALENLAFTELASKEGGGLGYPPDRYLGACISLAECGAMHLFIDRDLLGDIGEILFNGVLEGGEAALNDTLLEMLNIIAGRYLERVRREDFAMGLPALSADASAWEALPLRCLLSSDGGRELAVGLDPDGRLP